MCSIYIRPSSHMFGSYEMFEYRICDIVNTDYIITVIKGYKQWVDINYTEVTIHYHLPKLKKNPRLISTGNIFSPLINGLLYVSVTFVLIMGPVPGRRVNSPKSAGHWRHRAVAWQCTCWFLHSGTTSGTHREHITQKFLGIGQFFQGNQSVFASRGICRSSPDAPDAWQMTHKCLFSPFSSF